MLEKHFVSPAPRGLEATLRRGFPALFVSLIVCVSGLRGFAQVNSWNSLTSGYWEDAHWSLGSLPAPNQSIMITNTGFKAVGVSFATTLNFPASLTVSNLTISAPTNAATTLLLNYSGTTVPLHVLNNCTIASNATLMNLHSGFKAGGFTLEGGQFVQEDGISWVTNGFVNGGTVSFTNATVTFAGLNLGAPLRNYGVIFNQSGGSTMCSGLSIRQGTFNLYGGIFSGAQVVGDGGNGVLNQYAGTNRGSIILGQGSLFGYGGSGTYRLSGGRLEATSLRLASSGPPSSGNFSQSGGVVTNDLLQVGADNNRDVESIYALTHGTLISGSVSVRHGHLNQFGGEHIVNGPLSVAGYFEDYGSGTYFGGGNLSGGSLTCEGLYLSLFGAFNQTGGTNRIRGVLDVNTTSYALNGGALVVSSTIVHPGRLIASDAFVPTTFSQSGGLHQVGVLSCAGGYTLSGGTLVADGIALDGTLTAGSGPAAVIVNTGSFRLNGVLRLLNCTQALATVVLAGNAHIDLATGGTRLTFSNSSANTRSNGAVLTISNWNGSVSGGGVDRVFFGSSSGGLTQAQLKQIKFINPAGLPSGSYFAGISSSGEILPTPNPTLAFARAGARLVLNWPPPAVLQSATNLPGPFVDVPSALSPYTNFPGLPRQFFRLRL